MSLPFTPEQFFAVFARYNEAIWPLQIVLNAAALICIGLLFRPGVWASRLSYLILSLMWGWMAVAYYFTFFSDINSAAWVFGAVFLLGSAAFAWSGVAGSDASLRPVAGARSIVGGTLIVFALVLYPLIGYSIGHRYPNAPTFGLPCPTTIFTLGLLLFSVRPIARWLFIVPLLWAAVGSLAAFQLGVIEDLGLLVAGIATIAVMVFSPAPANPLLEAEANEEVARAG
jgi:hypothetical protein